VIQRPPVPAEPPPLISAPAQVRTSAGVPTVVPVTITNRSTDPRVYLVSPAGVDATWLPQPTQSTAVAPGESVRAELTLRPAEGTVPARYPLAIAVQALDPVTGALQGATSVQEIDLVVSAPGQIAISLDPPDSRAVHTRKLFVVLQNSGEVPETVRLEARSPQSTAIDLTRAPVVVPPASTVRVPARLTVSRPTLFRRPVRHTFSVTARTSAAPRYTEGSLTAKSLVGPTGAKIVAAIAVVALWVALALIFVPKLADKVRGSADQAANAAPTSSVAPPGSGKKGGKNGGTGGGGNAPSGGGSGSGGSGSGGSSSGGGASPASAAASGTPKKVQISGTVSGTSPGGVRVSIFPTTFGSSDATGGSGAATQAADTGPIGKLTPDAIEHTSLAPTPDQSGPAGSDGSFAFTVRTIGFYILQVAKPGYQTQRFVLDPTSATVAQPMKIALVPGTGSLHGVVHDAGGGNVGAATITITDGTNTVTTSTVSTGAGVGTWSVDGLSTPSSYLVSASHDGLGVASRLVTLAAGSAAPVDLTMSSGEGTLTGVVKTMIRNHNTPLGGITVSATDGTTTRTSTTVTTGSQTGLYTLPQLTVGTWTVTVSGAGYQLQTEQIKVAAGQKHLTHDIELTSSTVTVAGTVTGQHGKALRGAGLTLTDTDNGYKQTSLRGGSFSFGDVAPGTYTLTAEYSGYTSQTMTVKATLGTVVKPAHFALKLLHTSNHSTIVGFAANAISSSGSFGCLGTTAEPIGCRVYFRLFDSDNKRVDVTLNPSGDNVPQPSRDVSKLNGPVPYTLSIDMKPKDGPAPADGLEPGQYLLVISSPGFIPAKVEVQVPSNGVAAVPQVALKPDNTLAGHLKFTGDINQIVLPTDYPDPNCVLALPLKFNDINPNRFFCNQDQADAQNTTASPAYGPDDVAPYADKCTFTGASEPAVETVKDDGSFSLPRLCNGPYWIYVIIGNHAYVQPDLATPIQQTLLDGQTVEYDPSVDRYPTLTALVSDLDADGNPTKYTGATVTLTCDNKKIATDTTDGNGSVTFYGVPTGSPSCAIADADGNTAGVPGQFLQLNQDYTTTATIVNQTMTLVGQLVAPFGSSATNAIANVPVTITALTHYNGSTPVYETAQAITNAQGCYAVQPAPTTSTSYPASLDLAATAPGNTDCGTLTRTSSSATTNIAVLNATQTAVQVATANTTQVQALGTTGATLLRIPSGTATQSVALPTAAVTSLVPHSVSLNDSAVQFKVVDPAGNPVTIGGGTGLSFAGAALSVAKDAASGSGTINAGVTNDGFLTWSDSKAGANSIWPGRYTYTLTLPGYKAQVPADPALNLPDGALHGELDCGYTSATDSLGCTLSNANVIAFGTLSGTVRTTSGGSSVAVANADVYLDACTTNCTDVPTPSIACPTRTSSNPYYAQTDPNGSYDFSASGVHQVLPGDYRLIVCAPGVLPSVQKVTVTATSSAPLTVTMQWLGSVSGHLIGFNGVDLGSVPMTLNKCAADGTDCTTPVATTTTSSGGLFNFVSSDGLANFLLAGKYEVSATPIGYQRVAWPITVTMNPSGAPNDYTNSALQATAFGGYSGTVSNSFGLGVSGAKVTMTCVTVGGVACPASVTDPNPVTTNDNGKFTFTGGPNNTAFFLTPGQWQVTVTAAGYAPLVLDGSSINHPYQTINSGDNAPSTPLVLTPLGSLSGVLTDVVSGLPVHGATLHAVCADATTGCGSAGAQDATTDGSGNYSFGTAGARNVFAYGTWKFTISAPSGYYDGAPATTVTFSATNPTPAAPALTLRPFGSLSGQVMDSTNATVPVVGATVSATCTSGCGTGPTPTVAAVSTDSSGNFSFGTAGARNVFADGTWTVSLVGPVGYNAGSGGSYTFGPGSTALTAPSLTLRPEGSLSGKISDSTNTAVPVVGARVTATCQNSVCSSATAPSAVVTDSSGAFAFGSPGARNVFPDGEWLLSITGPTGYNDGTAPSTFTFDTGTTTATADSLTLRPEGSLSGKVVDSTNSALAVAGATVSAVCSCGTVDPVVTDSSGNFAFGSAGARNVFADGTWTVSVTAPTGYSDSGLLTSQAKTFGSGNLPAQTLTVNLDPLGSLTGTVSGVAAATQRLGSVTVTADRCDPADDTDTTCAGSTSAGTELSAVTNDTGVYTFTGAMAPGRWKLSTSATGYTATSKIVHIVAGANNASNMGGRTPSESPNLTMNAVPVDLPIKVIVTSTSAATKHAVVTVRRVDGGVVSGSSTSLTATLDGPTTTYNALGLLPTAYNVTVTGDNSSTGQSIQTTSVTIGIAATDPDPAKSSGHGTAPELDINVSLLDFQITGTVTGVVGNTGTTTTAVTGAPVVLLSSAPSSGVAGVAATDANDNAITATTGAGGSFTLGHVPNGTYYVSINQPDPTVLSPSTTPNNGFGGTLIGPITVLNGIYSLGTITPLAAVTHDVTVTLTKFSDDVLTGATPTLTQPGTQHWTAITGTVTHTTSTQVTYGFTAVPTGCWRFSLAGLPATHLGTMSQDTAPGSCPASSFQVTPAQDSSTVTAAVTLQEHELTVNSTLTTTGADTPPDFDLQIGSVDVGNISTATTKYYLPAGSYALTLTPSTAVSPRVWTLTVPTAAVNLNGAKSAAVSAVESPLESLTIPGFAGTSTSHKVTFVVSCSGTDCANISSYLPGTLTDDGSSPTTVVSGLPQGDYTVKATGTPVPGSETKSVTLSEGGSNTVVW
jgi:large repetitive protein